MRRSIVGEALRDKVTQTAETPKHRSRMQRSKRSPLPAEMPGSLPEPAEKPGSYGGDGSADNFGEAKEIVCLPGSCQLLLARPSPAFSSRSSISRISLFLETFLYLVLFKRP